MDRILTPTSRALLPQSARSAIAALLVHAPWPCDAQPVGPPMSAKAAAAPAPLYELKIDPTDLRAMERNASSDNTQPATLTIEGQDYGYVRVRFRGEWARSWPKKPLKIFFSRDKPFDGHRSVNLNSAWRDPAFIRETLAYHVYAVCGVPASRSRMVRLNVNGQFRGLYAEVEQVDDALLRRFNLSGTTLFKATSDHNQADERDFPNQASFATHYENETDKEAGLGELQRFCRELARTTNVIEFFTRRVDLKKYINYLAATVLVQHWDGFNKNHYLVHERDTGRWFVIPWDLDRTLGDHWNGDFDTANLSLLVGTRQRPSVTGWNRLQDRFFSEPALRARFLTRLEELLEKEFTTEKLFPMLDQFESALAEDAALDRRRWSGPSENFQSGIAEVKRFIQRRRAFLQSELKKLQ